MTPALAPLLIASATASAAGLPGSFPGVRITGEVRLEEAPMQRMGMVIGIKAEHIAEYKRLHNAVWPEVLERISACNIRNYTIFLREPENLLFGYWEYHVADFEADAAKMAADPRTQDWRAINMPLQAPLSTRKDGDW